MKLTVKRILCTIFAISMVALTLSGCSGKGSTTSSPVAPTSVSSSGEVSSDAAAEKIVFWHGITGTSADAIKQVVDEFQIKNSNIEVETVYIADMMAGGGTKLLAAIAGDDAPDVVYFDRFQIGSWAAKGALVDLSDKIKRDGLTAATFYPFSWDEVTYKDRQYGLPTNVDARLLYYNKDHFKEAGLDSENPPKTIAELEAAAQKLTVKKGNTYERLGFIPWFDQGFLYTWGWVFGGDYYDTATGKVTANDPNVVKALEWFVDYAKKYNVEDITAFTDSAGKEQLAPFIAGQLSMEISGNEMMAKIKKYNPSMSFGICPIPTPNGDNFTTWSGGWSIIMPKGSKNEEAGWQLIKYFATEGQESLNKAAGTLSVLDDVNNKLGYNTDPNYQQFITMLPKSHNRPVITQGQLMWNEMKQVTSLAINNQGEPKALLDGLTDKVNAELAKDAQNSK